MQKIHTIFLFTLGKECDFGEMINIVETDMFLDFNKNCIGYGFAIRDKIDAYFDKKNTLILSLNTDYILKASLEFKTENSSNTPEITKDILLKFGQNDITLDIPKLSSPLKEIVLLVKKDNNSVQHGVIPFIRFEHINLK